MSVHVACCVHVCSRACSRQERNRRIASTILAGVQTAVYLTSCNDCLTSFCEPLQWLSDQFLWTTAMIVWPVSVNHCNDWPVSVNHFRHSIDALYKHTNCFLRGGPNDYLNDLARDFCEPCRIRCTSLATFFIRCSALLSCFETYTWRSDNCWKTNIASQQIWCHTLFYLLLHAGNLHMWRTET